MIEKILLSDGQFNELQREFIELFETKTIIAGPGAGKTTALVAKITLLLRHLNKIGSKDGICVITHTNVAVNEINSILQKIGMGNIIHPHFIGTIHEFFNKFCVTPYFKEKLKHNSLFFDSEHFSDEDFFESFLELKESWMPETVRKAIARRIHTSELYFNDLSGSLDLKNTSNWDIDKFDRHKSRMLRAKIARKFHGFLQYDDTFVFSKLFLSHFRFKEVLRNRFKYVFIDEFQDTIPIGAELLKEVFNSENNIFQKVGDPYQTIMYGQPMPEINEEHTLFLNLTNRFGDQITQPLNVIMSNANIQSAAGKNSFKPVILLYDEEKDIYDKYKSIIKEYEDLEVTFKNSNKADKVLIWARDWISILKPGSTYKDKKAKQLESKNVILKNLVIDFIIKKISSSGIENSKIKTWITSHSRIIKLNIILLKIIKKNSIEEEKQDLKNFIKDILKEKGINNIEVDDQLFNSMENIISSTSTINEVKENVNDIFTIHSVKGETLRSVLVVDFNERLLTRILLHRYGIYEQEEYRYTDHNLLYVAMSRVTHLFVFAMHKDSWSDEVRNKLGHSWTIKEI
ncbi:UvrD-helicase domain-containing protein [Metabacillus fastidiosus]|uniref:UvrD-helicase domain-containing protein n=1 Tax=Metabacillus fastidiosus TaxID=1458 RepID=UPI003D28130C